MNSGAGWIGVDLDATLAYYTRWVGVETIGPPVPKMVERVRRWLNAGREVRVMTARIYPYSHVIQTSEGSQYYLLNHPDATQEDRCATARLAANCIQQWLKEHVGVVLPLTCVKDFAMIELWDDRAVQVLPNTGMSVLEDATQTLRSTAQQFIASGVVG